jgi:hypothetical protein
VFSHEFFSETRYLKFLIFFSFLKERVIQTKNICPFNQSESSIPPAAESFYSISHKTQSKAIEVEESNSAAIFY